MVAAMANDEYVEEVLRVVERIPAGRVMSYGAIAEYLRERTGTGGARQVGTVMSRYGGLVPWHRVVAADGRLVPGHEGEATRRHRAEGTPMRGAKVDMGRASWWPETG
jgi:methylated-DNA-protein-cysteine methyltransferase-like protein